MTDIRKTKRPLWRPLLKVLLLTVMAIVLIVFGTLTCVVKVLSPDRLTPLIVNIANKQVDAQVGLARAELAMRPAYPFLSLTLDSLSIISPKMRTANSDIDLPPFADSLLAVTRFSGALNIGALARGCIEVSDVTILEPRINFVALNDSVNNLDIFGSTSEDEADDGSTMFVPQIEVHRFNIAGPSMIRYYDLASDMKFDMQIEALLEKPSKARAYHLKFGGNMLSPILQIIKKSAIDVTLDGDIDWSPSSPYAIKLRDFVVGADIFKAKFNLDADLERSLLVKGFDMVFEPIEMQGVINMLPDSLIATYGLGALRTNANLSLSMRLDSVFNSETDSVPRATVDMAIAPCSLTYGRSRLHDVSADMSVITCGNDLDKAVVLVRNLTVAGPATQLRVSANVSNLISDPTAECSIEGFTNLANLPSPLMRFVDGYISGKLDLSLQAKGSMSMLSPNNFHKLKVDGKLNADRLYWVSSDTANMAYLNSAGLDFGTKRRLGNSAANLLAAVIKVDSLDVLSGTLGIRATDFSLGLASENTSSSLDTTTVTPMGGGMKIKSLDISAITDSAGARFRAIDGRVVIKRFNELKRVPEFIFDLGIERFGAGAPDASMLFSKSRLHFSAHKLPVRKPSKAVLRLVDSIKVARPDLPMDSVYRLAIARHNLNRKPYRRVHMVETDSTSEIIEWGTSTFVSKLLTNWALSGSLSADRARFYTPHFPLRNRLRNINLNFNNDSITIKDMLYKVGRSDFLAAGRISNIRRALTRKNGRQPIKVLFETASDTIDVNQLADAFFKGASYGAGRSHNAFSNLDIDEDDAYDSQVDDIPADSVSPMLIPLNLEAELKVKAKNVLYSDLDLRDLSGDVLVYDGAINLHELKASSEVGSVDLTALYSAPERSAMRFGFGLKVNRFDINRFMELVPALDTIMPLLNDISGIIDADLAATVDIDEQMDFKLPTLTAAIKLQGDSLQLLDRETFRTVAKWLMFKDKQRNIIDSMTVEMIIADNQMDLFPFVFNIDRYKLGVQGHNDLAMNFNYLISVLKSPLPFKFGITLKGNPDDYKIRLGRAKFNEKQAVERKLIVDTTRVNLVDQIENVFKRGVRRSKFATLNLSRDTQAAPLELDENISASDSITFIKEGLIEAPKTDIDSNTVKKQK